MKKYIFLFYFFLGSFFLTAEAKQTICLNMVVTKKSSYSIERSLTSIKPLIDYWVIVDAGSSGGTKKLIQQILQDIPGEFHKGSGKSYVENRKKALCYAKDKADYLLIAKEDEELVYAADLKKPVLDKDFYYIQNQRSSMSRKKIQLINNHLEWKWAGRLYEYLDSAKAKTHGIIENIVVHKIEDNSKKDVKKYRETTENLIQALAKEPNNARYIFYLAQGYRNMGDISSAIKFYKKRAEMGGWDQEVFWSLYQIAWLQQKEDLDPKTFMKNYFRAYQYRPNRAEPLYYIANYHRRHNDFLLAYQTARNGLAIPYPKDQIFVEDWIYEWGLLFEFSQAAYQLEKYDEAYKATEELLTCQTLPTNMRKLIKSNLARISDKKERSLQDNKLPKNKKVLLAILARNKAHVLPRYLECIENLDYDKELIGIYINTNNNSDDTQEMLKKWMCKHADKYRFFRYENEDLNEKITLCPHIWDARRFEIIGNIRNRSLQMVKEFNCDYYFVVDCDNFIIPSTLKELMRKNKPIIAPMLKAIPERDDPYSNFFCAINDKGYFRSHPDYMQILHKVKQGTFKVPLVYSCYLIKAEYLDKLGYIDDTDDCEFIIFSRIARKNNIPQYICNKKEFGYLLHFHDDGYRFTLEEEQKRLKNIPFFHTVKK